MNSLTMTLGLLDRIVIVEWIIIGILFMLLFVAPIGVLAAVLYRLVLKPERERRAALQRDDAQPQDVEQPE